MRQKPIPPQRSWSSLLEVLRLAGATLTLGLAGCQSFKTPAECVRVMSAVNRALDGIRDVHSAPPTSERYEQIATSYQELQHSLLEMTIHNPSLEKAATTYAKRVERVARESRNYSEALSGLEQARLDPATGEDKRAEARLEAIRRRSKKLAHANKNDAKRLADVCRPGR